MALADEIIKGNQSAVIAYLNQGEDVNETDRFGFTPLIEAAVMDNLEMAALLIKRGADVNQPDVTGRTALHWAVDNHNIPFCQLLLERKANPNAYTIASQPAIINPLLRGQQDLRRLLCRYGADLAFGQDFINTKLIGHRYELVGEVDIVNHLGHFIELDFEGFFLEFTLSILQNSLTRYKNNFAARKVRQYFPHFDQMIKAVSIATELIRYQHYNLDLKPYLPRIHELMKNELLLIPVAYEGHAICFIKIGKWLAKCDRGEGSHIHGSVVLYEVKNPEKLNAEFFKYLIYKKQTRHFIFTGIYKVLEMVAVTQLPIPTQITGNCSWANLEASVPTMLFLLLLKDKTKRGADEVISAKEEALFFYKEWQTWDKDVALHECIESFYSASPARKASKAAILGNILFQRCQYTNPKDVERAERILAVLTIPDYRYVLDSYLNVYWRDGWTKEGNNLVHLLEMCGIG